MAIDKYDARRTDFELVIDGADVTDDVKPYLISLSYTDNQEDECDDLQIVLQDRAMLWTKGWLNNMVEAAASLVGEGGGTVSGGAASLKSNQESSGNSKKATIGTEQREAYEASVRNMATGLKISATIIRQNWTGHGEEDKLPCGEFELDSLIVSGPPNTITIKATSLSYGQPIRQTKRSQAWESYNLSGIASEMASKNGLGCDYLASTDPYYDYEEQDQQSDIDFLSGLCHEAGLSLKCTDGKLVIFSQKDEEAKDPVMTITNGESPYSGYKLTIAATDANYNACRVSYVDKDGKLIEGTAYASGYSDPTQDTETGEITDTNQVLEISHRVTSIGEAQALASYYLRLRNKYGKQTHFDMAGDPVLLAGANYSVEGWGSFDGKYSITTAKHAVSSSGYRVSVDGRWIEAEPVKEEVQEAVVEKSSGFSVGDKVKIADGAPVYGMGITLQDWCYGGYEFEVIQVGGEGLPDDRVVVGINGVVTAAIAASDLYT